MNTLELVSFLRKNILDDTGGEGVDWTSFDANSFDSVQLRWNNDELVANINEAITQVYRRTQPIKDVEVLEIVAGQTLYPLSPYILQVENIRLLEPINRELEITALDQLYKLSNFESLTKTPRYFIPDYLQNNLRLYPTPNESVHANMVIYRSPKTKLDWKYPTASPELLDIYSIPMLYYAAHLCYMKDEANCLDPNRAMTYSQMFDREFPFTSVYSNIRKARTANRSIKYGGI